MVRVQSSSDMNLDSPSTKRKRLSYDSVTEDYQTIEKIGSVSLFPSLNGSRTKDLQSFKIDKHGLVSKSCGKDLHIFDIRSPNKVYLFEAPLSDLGKPFMTSIIKPHENSSTLSLLVVASNGVYRHWEDIEYEDTFTESVIALVDDQETYFEFLVEHPTERGLLIVSTNKGNQIELLRHAGNELHLFGPLNTPIIDYSETTTNETSLFSWLPWFKRKVEKKHLTSDYLEEYMIAVQFVEDTIYTLTNIHIVAYSLKTKQVIHVIPILSNIKELLELGDEVDVNILDLSCPINGEHYMEILLSYQDVKVYNVVHSLEVTEAHEIKHNDPILIDKATQLGYQGTLFSTNEETIQVLLNNDQLHTISRINPKQTQHTFDTPIKCANITHDDRFYLIDNQGSTFLVINTSQNNQPTHTITTSQEPIAPDRQHFFRSQASEIVTRARLGTFHNIDYHPESITLASRYIIDQKPSNSYQWLSIQDMPEDEENQRIIQLVDDLDPKVPTLITQELRKKQRTHANLLQSLVRCGTFDRLPTLKQSQIISDGELVNFCIHLRELQNQFKTQTRIHPTHSKDHKLYKLKMRTLNASLLKICEAKRAEDIINTENFYSKSSLVYQLFDHLHALQESQLEEERNDQFHGDERDVTTLLCNLLYVTCIKSAREYHVDLNEFDSDHFKPISIDLHVMDLMANQISIACSNPSRQHCDDDATVQQISTMVDFLLEFHHASPIVSNQLLLHLHHLSPDHAVACADRHFRFDSLIDMLVTCPSPHTKQARTLQKLINKYSGHHDDSFVIKVFQRYVDQGWATTLLTHPKWNQQFPHLINRVIRHKDQLAWIHASKHLRDDHDRFDREYILQMKNSLMNMALGTNHLRDRVVRLSMFKLSNLIQDDDESSNVDHTLLLNTYKMQKLLSTKYSLDAFRSSWLDQSPAASSTNQTMSQKPLLPNQIIALVQHEINANQLQDLIDYASDSQEMTQQLQAILYCRLACAMSIYDDWHDELDSNDLVCIYKAALVSSLELRLEDEQGDASDDQMDEEHLVQVLKRSVFYQLARRFIGRNSMLSRDVVGLLNEPEALIKYLPALIDLLEADMLQ
ncbi:nucleoporin Nup133 [Acrasis kona]|uniref:Nucleoporin Nup133 n=1 Tax=Acrasis kona TaxID=1008807 RepID=A0AAW2ZEA3_9EUKA